MTNEKDILTFVDDYTQALILGNEQKMHQLEDQGRKQQATLTDVGKAITNLMLGVNDQINTIESNNELNLNILIDALYKAELINDDVLGYIQESIDKTEEENEDNDKK